MLLPSGVKLAVGSSIAPTRELEMGDGTYRANMEFKGDALGLANAADQGIYWTADGIQTTSIERAFNGDFIISNAVDNARTRMYVSEGGVNKEYIQLNPAASSLQPRINLNERTSVKSLTFSGVSVGITSSIDLNESGLVKLSSSGAGTVNNFINGSSDGGLLVITNTGAGTATLTNLAGGSGQMHFAGGADITLTQRQGVVMYYDGTLNGWIELAHS